MKLLATLLETGQVKYVFKRVDKNHNTYSVGVWYDPSSGKVTIRSWNQNRVPLSLSNHMFMKPYGLQTQEMFFKDAVRNLFWDKENDEPVTSPPSPRDVLDAIKDVTELDDWTLA